MSSMRVFAGLIVALVGLIAVSEVLDLRQVRSKPVPPTRTEILQNDVRQLVRETAQLRAEIVRLKQLPGERHYCRISVKRADLPKTHGLYDYTFELKLDRTGCELVDGGLLEVTGKHIDGPNTDLD